MRWAEQDGIRFEIRSPLQVIMNSIMNPFRNYLIPAFILKAVLRRSSSPLIRETFIRPGSWQSMRIVYENAEPKGIIDRLAIRDNSISMATRNRRQLVTAILTRIISSLKDTRNIQILGVGSGPGVQIQDAICQASAAHKVTAYLVDLDADAVPYGRQLADERGLGNVVHFLSCDAREIETVLPDFHPHVVKIVGLLEYLTDEQALQLLTKMHTVMATGGTLVTHGMVDRYGVSPFFERTFGLRHWKRSGEEIDALLRRAGFSKIASAETPMRIYPIRMATK